VSVLIPPQGLTAVIGNWPTCRQELAEEPRHRKRSSLLC
jgi:hypothetical protein